MDLSPKNSMVGIPDLRHRLRQLRWFIKAFRSNAELVENHFGVRYAIDEKALHMAFFNWIDAIEAQDHAAKLDRADYIVFLGGLALASLITAEPVTATGRSAPMVADPTNADLLGFWPEGFLYTNFCICAIAAVQEQEGEQPANLQQAASELRTWWSFRENTMENPSMAVPFLDRFLGSEPNWQFPASARQRLAIRKAIEVEDKARLQGQASKDA